MTDERTDTELVYDLLHAHRDHIGFHDTLIAVERRLAEYRRVVAGYRRLVEK